MPLDAASAVLAVKPETFLSHWRDIRDAKDELGSFSTALARTKKAAKRDGVDLDAVKLLEKLAMMETDERQTFLAKVDTYAQWIELPLGAFSVGKAVEPRDTARDDFRKWQAGEDGKKAGLDGKPKESNPHRQGTQEAQAWDRKWALGFKANQKKIATSMAKGTGAPRKGANAANAAVAGKMAAAGEGASTLN